MPEQQVPQSESPGNGSGLVSEVPQAQPAAGNGPDSHNMPNLGQQVARQSRQERDYEASFKGLNDWVNKEFNELRQTVNQMSQIMMQNAQQPQAPQKQAPAPVSGGNEAKPQSEEPSAIDLALQAKKAEQYRDLLLEEYEKATGLPVSSFRKHIAVAPPEMNPDGSLNDAAQRALIDDFVAGLKGLRGEAQEQVLKGHTPGSAPGAAAPEDTAANLYQEFKDIMTVMGLKEFDDMEPGKQAQVERRYFELLEEPAIQDQHDGNLQPAMDYEDMASELRRLSREVARLQGSVNPKMA